VISGNTATWNGGGLAIWDSGTVAITDSSISNNSAGGAGGGLSNQNQGTLTVTGSALLGNTSSGEGGAVYSDVDTVNATSVTGSCVVGNGDTAFFNERSAFQNATANWWGDPTGPSGAGTGSGDSVSANVDFSGWLTEPPAICASP
jgi:hypothetical protein